MKPVPVIRLCFARCWPGWNPVPVQPHDCESYYRSLKNASPTVPSFRNLAVLGGSKTDPQTAEDMSKSLGDHEVRRFEYNVSRSVDTRNTSDQGRRETERLVTPSEIQSFKDLTGYVAFSGDYPIAKVQMRFQHFPEVVEPFMESEKLRRFESSALRVA